ncbi:hypothetical protein B1F79_03060 [Coxiella-like endosymbiont of Rhipicephalus sanguineus]|uniref:PQQ-dependent sugar dehydrogenase n=1 Tax=Coxiella-like endosymbiont of Rhipicephalus sanguineus TaxID=1955402 RepID=UPI003558A027|nr:hypothetical protein [Coxiella-like endosymbiont of Rhipicephalus sanguineus]
MKDDGSVLNDNPYPGCLIYPYGSRDPQRMAWDFSSNLWITEHGSIIHDEINL